MSKKAYQYIKERRHFFNTTQIEEECGIKKTSLTIALKRDTKNFKQSIKLIPFLKKYFEGWETNLITDKNKSIMKNIKIGSYEIQYKILPREENNLEKNLSWWEKHAEERKGLVRIAMEESEQSENIFENIFGEQACVFYVSDYDNFFIVNHDGEKVSKVRYLDVTKVVKDVSIHSL